MLAAAFRSVVEHQWTDIICVLEELLSPTLPTQSQIQTMTSAMVVEEESMPSSESKSSTPVAVVDKANKHSTSGMPGHWAMQRKALILRSLFYLADHDLMAQTFIDHALGGDQEAFDWLLRRSIIRLRLLPGSTQTSPLFTYGNRWKSLQVQIASEPMRWALRFMRMKPMYPLRASRGRSSALPVTNTAFLLPPQQIAFKIGLRSPSGLLPWETKPMYSHENLVEVSPDSSKGSKGILAGHVHSRYFFGLSRFASFSDAVGEEDWMSWTGSVARDRSEAESEVGVSAGVGEMDTEDRGLIIHVEGKPFRLNNTPAVAVECVDSFSISNSFLLSSGMCYVKDFFNQIILSNDLFVIAAVNGWKKKGGGKSYPRDVTQMLGCLGILLPCSHIEDILADSGDEYNCPT